MYNQCLVSLERSTARSTYTQTIYFNGFVFTVWRGNSSVLLKQLGCSIYFHAIVWIVYDLILLHIKIQSFLPNLKYDSTLMINVHSMCNMYRTIVIHLHVRLCA